MGVAVFEKRWWAGGGKEAVRVLQKWCAEWVVALQTGGMAASDLGGGEG